MDQAVLWAMILMASTPAHAVIRPAARAVEVTFSSQGSGVNRSVQTQVLALVAEIVKEVRLSKMTAKPWGREGEWSLCLEYFDWQHARQQAEPAIKRIIEASGDELTSYVILLDCSGAMTEGSLAEKFGVRS